VKDGGEFKELQRRVSRLNFRVKDFSIISKLKSKVEEQLRRMARDIVSVHLVKNNIALAPAGDGEVVGIRKLGDPNDYSSITGIKLSEALGCII
jgi:hypothetical protein